MTHSMKESFNSLNMKLQLATATVRTATGTR